MRQTLPYSDLVKQVEEITEDLVTNSATFSAYDLTTELRAAHPGQNISHDEVREAVHGVMVQVINTGTYDRQLQTYPGGDAWTYFPYIQGTSQPTPPSVPPTPASPIPTFLSWLPPRIADDD